MLIESEERPVADAQQAGTQGTDLPGRTEMEWEPIISGDAEAEGRGVEGKGNLGPAGRDNVPVSPMGFN